ncbi:MAG: 5-formyltetrahydrofolate cyclo-ligase [Ilumatobacteraceae bacterium]|nr:5-formyltetrahydrofolate cyclo-ligase [Ilumatobacteraceae bacterium]
MDDKPAIRRRMRLLRDLIDDRLLRSVQLWAAVATLPEYAAATTVMAFVGTRGEPDTDPLFARLERDGKQLVLPRTHGDHIEPALLGDGLRTGAFAVPEPSGEIVEVAAVGLVLVPGLAFMVDGTRLGQGGGHYDRFLATCPAPSIGVCFAEQLVDELPVASHDIRVARVVTA